MYYRSEQPLERAARIRGSGGRGETERREEGEKQNETDLVLVHLSQHTNTKMSDKPKKLAPYLVFAGETRDVAKNELIAAGNPKPTMGEIAKAVGEKWKALDDAGKQVRV